MATTEPTAVESAHPNEDNLRRLWFDYLSKLNDRELQSSRASGITTWALLAVAAVIVYRGVPEIPRLLSQAGAVRGTVVALILEIDVAFFLALGVVGLFYYCSGEAQARLLPECNRRAAEVTVWVGWACLLALAAGHFLVALLLGTLPFVRWVLIAFGALWLWDLIDAIRRRLKKERQARRHKLPAPSFTVSRFGPAAGPLIAVGMLPFAALSAASLITFLRSLHGPPTAWILPLAAGTEGLLLIVVLATLLFRGLSSTSRGVFLALERDVVLYGLKGSELKARYIRDVLGTSVADWLEELDQKRRQNMSEMRSLLNSLEPKAAEIESLDSSLHHERSGRARDFMGGYRSRIHALIEELRGTNFLLRQLLREASPETWEIEALSRILREWESELDEIDALTSSATPYLERLEALGSEAQQ